MRLELEMPTSLPSVANLREHWLPRSRRSRRLRASAYLVMRTSREWREAAAAAREHGATITLTRVAKRGGLDSDNLASAFKPVRDGIADALELDDGDRRLVWLYADEKGKPDRVRVAIEVPSPPIADVCTRRRA